MPSRPVAASSHSVAIDRGGLAGGGAGGADGASWSHRHAITAQARLSTAQTSAVRVNPHIGTSQNAAASTPSTAPAVLPAYSAASAAPRPCQRASTRSIAGKVAPIAIVAGNSSTKVPAKATVHCRKPLGCAPVSASSHGTARAGSAISTSPHRPMSASHAAYQRAGRADRSMRAPNAHAPRARPPKKAPMTASTAAISWPSHNAPCCVHTIW